MNPTSDNLRLWRGAILLLLLVIVASQIFTSFDSYNSQIIYRYAEQFRAGNGLVFNSGERTLLVPAPLYMLLLGIAAALTPSASISTIASTIFVLALVIGAIAIFNIVRSVNLTILSSVLTALLYIVYVAVWRLGLDLGNPYPVASMFCLLAIATALADRWQLAGLTLAFAALCGPESLILAIPLLITAVNKGKGLRFAMVLLATLLLAALILRMYYGVSLLDGLLLAKKIGDVGNPWLWILPLIALGPLAWIMSRRRAIPVLTICSASIASYFLIVIGLLRISASDNLILVAGPLVLFVVVGLTSPFAVNSEEQQVTLRGWNNTPSLAITLLIIFLVMIFVVATPIVDGPPPQSFPQATTIGLYTAYNVDLSPQQSVISFDGQLQPELKAMVERGDMQSALIRYAPDAIVIGDVGRLRARDLNSPTLARLAYYPGERSHIYVRGATIGSFADTPITANFGPDIKLVGAALDQTSLRPGQLLRVRLDWQFARPASRDVTVDLRLISGDGDQYLLAHATDTYDPSVFRVGPYSTYHTLTVVNSAWRGPVALQAAIVINGGMAARVPITTLNITTAP